VSLQALPGFTKVQWTRLRPRFTLPACRSGFWRSSHEPFWPCPCFDALLREKLDKAAYTVEVDDGEDVLVKKKGGQPNFNLMLLRNTVKAVRINIERK
jgi:hypothetical protein